MDREQVIDRVGTGRVVAIIRGDYRGAEIEIAGTLREAGVPAVELTLNSPDALRSIGAMAARFGGRMAVGAGTVLTVEDVGRVADAGASFVVSPNRDVDVIDTTRRREMVSFPGCFTPSEIVEALNAGADAIKLFPSRGIDASYVADLLGPFEGVRLIPTGGIDASSARGFFNAGAWAVGVGSILVSSDVLKPGGLERLALRARDLVATLHPPVDD